MNHVSLSELLIKTGVKESISDTEANIFFIYYPRIVCLFISIKNNVHTTWKGCSWTGIIKSGKLIPRTWKHWGVTRNKKMISSSLLFLSMSALRPVVIQLFASLLLTVTQRATMQPCWFGLSSLWCCGHVTVKYNWTMAVQEKFYVTFKSA